MTLPAISSKFADIHVASTVKLWPITSAHLDIGQHDPALPLHPADIRQRGVVHAALPVADRDFLPDLFLHARHFARCSYVQIGFRCQSHVFLLCCRPAMGLFMGKRLATEIRNFDSAETLALGGGRLAARRAGG